MNTKEKILYVDDEILNLQLFEINFTKKYNVLTAENPLDGLKLLEQNLDICIIISDMKMPGMTGIEFITHAKKKFPDKKYFILTGYEISEPIRTALDDGLILKYFSKPFNIKEIDEIIEKTLSEKN